MQTPIPTSGQQSWIDSWDNLLPNQEIATFDDPFAQLTPEQLSSLANLSRIHWLFKTGKASPEGPSGQEAKRIEQAFAQNGINVNWLLSQREVVRQRRIEQVNNQNINGQRVKLPGLTMALAWNGAQQVTHFLLMPYLGECSHVPPPPSNQVVYVEAVVPVEMRNPTNSFFPWMWVEGVIKFAVTTHTTYRMDGWMRLESSYAIAPTTITPCSPKDIAHVFAQRTRTERAQLYPRLIDLS